MQKLNDPNDYELEDEYDLSQMPVLPKGRYDPKRRVAKNIIVLAPDLAQSFPTDDSVNEALRLVLRISEIPKRRRRRAASG
ncbi:MAG: hypothetical protein MUC34_09875 [Anaerolineae bacterium]|jgi:hypothetical protein|nr:hypothetical protein [Anaerolineae bacterium]